MLTWCCSNFRHFCIHTPVDNLFNTSITLLSQNTSAATDSTPATTGQNLTLLRKPELMMLLRGKMLCPAGNFPMSALTRSSVCNRHRRLAETLQKVRHQDINPNQGHSSTSIRRRTVMHSKDNYAGTARMFVNDCRSLSSGAKAVSRGLGTRPPTFLGLPASKITSSRKNQSMFRRSNAASVKL